MVALFDSWIDWVIWERPPTELVQPWLGRAEETLVHSTVTAPSTASVVCRRASTTMRPLFPRVTYSPHRVLHRPFSSTMAQRGIVNPALFICDVQESFRPAIYEFPKVVATAQKLLKASQILKIPVIATTQNAARLGSTVPELKLDAPDGVQTTCHVDKTLFSMITPDVRTSLAALTPGPDARLSVAIVGIESHICVTQTALDLLHDGHQVYIIADGVSSCNKEEVPIALARLRSEGAIVASSEGWLYEVVGDAKRDTFKQIVKVVKEHKDSTRESLQTLCKI
ncbi:Isochorismatase hydrolase [Dothidotthia symphoricarpi CBS 119687]|uniref:Isochorismatase hydrolase n=1 Tax=Dothidotthia symphoricarpi CBS 119687 TaxID=1392245 RepID=A0A6A6A4M6_9PLEO|nr:Isochorismatase hydrolase [Dothidotthia symphoricarpi CBS 119687]KAF2126125.1 Isochorismatase hydrolase [Dothidotthia symphoricarpi CBS 119687]